jgi:hypothetical protein
MALRVPFSWLKDYVSVTLTPQQLAERLTVAGMEVESVTAIGADWGIKGPVLSERDQNNPRRAEFRPALRPHFSLRT